MCRVNRSDALIIYVEVKLTLRASKLLLISAPSMRVCLSALHVSTPLSLPAHTIHTCKLFNLLQGMQIESHIVKECSAVTAFSALSN